LNTLNEEKERYLFSSESVPEGHPDKVADQASVSVLYTIIVKKIDQFLENTDPNPKEIKK
jgi:S-adenosylmethionine synthetase